MPDLRELIDRHEAHHAERISLTPKGAAHAAARRFAATLRDIDDPKERMHMLAAMVCNFENDGERYSLSISMPPVRDPEVA